MPDEPIVGEEHEGERPKPRVVDKRFSARPAESKTKESGGDTTPDSAPPDSAGAVPEPTAGAATDVWTPEQEAEARAIAEEISRRPGVEWVVNSAVSLANIAATKIEMGHAADARIVIDSLAGLLGEVGAQLGNVEQPLRQTLAQLQLAYAEHIRPPATP